MVDLNFENFTEIFGGLFTSQSASLAPIDSQGIASLISFYLADLVKYGNEKQEEAILYSGNKTYAKDFNLFGKDINVTQIVNNETETPQLKPQELFALSNIINEKDENKKLCELDFFKNFEENTLLLNQAVPYVKIYKVIKHGDGTQEEVNIPFDIVGNTTTGVDDTFLPDKILKGGSGGAVGITNFKWLSEGRNEGNNSLYTVNFKIFLQDISEIDRVRNSFTDKETNKSIPVKILDLLYYDYGSAPNGSFEYDSENLVFKADVGFSLPEKYKNLEKYFRTSLFLTVYRHNFTFNETGMVELDLTAVGSTDSFTNDLSKTNIINSRRYNDVLKAVDIFNAALNSDSKEELIAWTKIAPGSVRERILIRKSREQLAKKIEKEFFGEGILGTVGNVITSATTVAVARQQLSGILAPVVAKFAAFGPLGWASVAVAGAALYAASYIIPEFGNLQKEDKLDTLFFGKATSQDNFGNPVDFTLEEIKQIIREKILPLLEILKRTEAIAFLPSLIREMKEKNIVNYLEISRESYDKLQTLLKYEGTDITQIKTFLQRIKSKNDNAPPVLQQPPQPKQKNEKIDFELKWSTWLGGDTGASFNFSKYYQDRQKEITGLSKDKVFVEFVYLGHLLETMIKRSDDLEKSLNIHLGSFQYYDYRASILRFDPSKPRYTIVTDQNKSDYYETINLVPEIGGMYWIPISIPSLLNWYSTSVISEEGLTPISFDTFLKQLFQEIIPANIGNKLFKNSPVNVLQTTRSEFTAPSRANRLRLSEDRTTNPTKITQKEIRLLKNLQGTPQYLFVPTKDEIKYFKNYKNIVILAANQTENVELKGDLEEDCKNNISWLSINSMNSFVKRINFNRDDNPQLEAANLIAAQQSGKTGFVRQVYHASVEMFGNNFFTPGDVVYIRPTYPGVPLTFDILYDIGLGGYYTVVQIDNTVSTSGYATNLKCIWSAFGSQRDALRQRTTLPDGASVAGITFI